MIIKKDSCLIGCIVMQEVRVKLNGMINQGVFRR